MYEKEQRFIRRVIKSYFKSVEDQQAEDKALEELTTEEKNEAIDSTDAANALWEHRCQHESEGFEFLAEHGVMLAGGTINSIFTKREINDLDFYLKDITKLQAVHDGLVKTFGYKKIFESDNAITYKKKRGNREFEVQIITRFHGEPTDILNTFDFTIVQGLYDFSTKQYHFSDRFFADIGKRELVYTNTSQYPICALYRTKKYVKRGYHITGANIVALSLAIHALKITTYKDLKDQMTGIDTAMFTELTKDFDMNKSFEVSEFVRDWLEIAMDFDSEY